MYAGKSHAHCTDTAVPCPWLGSRHLILLTLLIALTIPG